MDPKAWRDARLTNGLSLEDVVYLVRNELGKGFLTKSTLQRLEKSPPKHVNPVLLGTLAELYGSTVGTIDASEAAGWEKVRDKVKAMSRWIPVHPDQLTFADEQAA